MSKGTGTAPRWARRAEQEVAAEANRAWHEARAVEAEKRRKAAAKAKAKAGPQGGRLRALAIVAERMAGETPVTRAAVQKVERDRRGRMVPVRNPNRDRRLAGKARIRARRAGAR